MTLPSAPSTRPRIRAPRPALAALHVFALAGFAVAQPIFDLVGRSPTFFVAHDAARPRDLLCFALVLSIGAPALLVLFEIAVGLVSRRLRRGLHLTIVAALVGLVVLPPLHHLAALPSAAAFAVAGMVGAAAALAYARGAAVRTWCTVLALAALVFPAVFLFWSPVAPLLRPAAAAGLAVTVARPIPVVMVVFDELSTFALMNEAGAIDAVRFPSFAALARESTWYRNATSVADYTPLALPALLTGRLPDRNRVPTVAEHPGNLFTVLDGTYRLHVAEPVTQLCPPAACPAAGANGAAAGRRTALLADALLLYLHALAPADLRARLPDVKQQWTFRFQRWLRSRLLAPTTGDRPGAFRAFIDGITARPGAPTLHVAHVLLPHYPYEYLPSGARYEAPPADFHRERLDPSRPVHHRGWAADNPAGAAQEQQRYLLQLALVDRLLGELLERLRATGLFDEALVVVTADHGVSFRPGESQRFVTPTNREDILWVPLFVHLPGQRVGAVDDRPAQTIDVLPTVADALGIALPWHPDGHSLLSDTASTNRVAYTPAAADNLHDLRRLAVPTDLPEQPPALTSQLRLFGSGADASALYATGPFPALLGRVPEPESRAVPAPITVRLADAARYREVRPERGVVPSFVRGRLEPRDAIGEPPALAIAVNGAVAATTEAFVADDRSISFGALVPDTAFRPGENRVEVFVIRPEAEGGLALHLVAPAARSAGQPDAGSMDRIAVGRSAKRCTSGPAPSISARWPWP